MLTQAYGTARVKSTRDTQKRRLYKADDVLRPFAQPLPSVKDVERYCRKVWRSKRFRKAFPLAVRREPPRVKDGRGQRNALAFGGYAIGIPLWARKTDVVLHELAHIVTNRHGQDVASHGWEFCAVYLKMVLYFMGREAHDAFKASMKAHRVRFRQPRKGKPLSPERRAQLIAALAAARAKS